MQIGKSHIESTIYYRYDKWGTKFVITNHIYKSAKLVYSHLRFDFLLKNKIFPNTYCENIL